jgi:hypothetical protein
MADGPIVLKLRPPQLLRSGAQRRGRIRDGSVGEERMPDQRSAPKQGPQLIEAETGSASVSKEVDVAAVGRRTSAKKSSHRIGSSKGSHPGLIVFLLRMELQTWSIMLWSGRVRLSESSGLEMSAHLEPGASIETGCLCCITLLLQD